MSVNTFSPSKRSVPALSLNCPPRLGLLQIGTLPSNSENFAEVSTPLLPKKTRFNSTIEVPSKKLCRFSQQPTQEADSPGEKPAQDDFKLKIVKIDGPIEPLSASSQPSEAGSSGCAEESPLVKEIEKPRKHMKKIFDEDLYKRAEEFLDSENLVIVHPEDLRKRPFSHLRVSTAKVIAGQASDVASENNSPSLISPSIQTSTLFQRRSTTTKEVQSALTRPNITLAKSPFYSYKKKPIQIVEIESEVNKELFNNEEIQEEPGVERPSPRKRPFVVTSLNTKLQEVAFRGSRDHSEISSATSLKMEEYSPLKILV